MQSCRWVVGRKLGRQLRGGRRAGRYVRRKQLAAGRWTGRQVGRQTMGSGRQVGSQAGVQLGRLTYRWAHRLASSRPLVTTNRKHLMS